MGATHHHFGDRDHAPPKNGAWLRNCDESFIRRQRASPPVSFVSPYFSLGVRTRGHEVAVLTVATPNILLREVEHNINVTRDYCGIHGYRCVFELREPSAVWAEVLPLLGGMSTRKTLSAEWKRPHPRWNLYPALMLLLHKLEAVNYVMVIDADNAINRLDLALQVIAVTDLHRRGSVVMAGHAERPYSSAKHGTSAVSAASHPHGPPAPFMRFQGSAAIYKRTPWTDRLLHTVMGLAFGEQKHVPPDVWATKEMHAMMHEKLDYLGFSGVSMNQNLWVAYYWHDWDGARSQICPYTVREDHGIKYKTILPVHLYCTQFDMKRPQDRLMGSPHCFTHLSRTSNYTHKGVECASSVASDLSRNSYLKCIGAHGKGI